MNTHLIEIFSRGFSIEILPLGNGKALLRAIEQIMKPTGIKVEVQFPSMDIEKPIFSHYCYQLLQLINKANE